MSEEVRRIRGSMKLTQAELADLLGVTQATVSRWEAGKLPVDARTLIALKALQVQQSGKAAA
jgi:transcriptional regulator with XRE-family HTH domain